MKHLTQYFNENLAQENFANEALVSEDNHSADEYKEVAKDIEENIGELEEYLNKLFGIKIKLSINVKPRSIEIESDNFIPKLKDKLWSCLFDEFQFGTWGGQFNNDGNIWFNPKVFYHFHAGGSNGNDIYGLSSIWWKPSTKEWVMK